MHGPLNTNPGTKAEAVYICLSQRINLGIYVLQNKAYLDSGAGVQHNVLDGALNILRPRDQPSHLIVMTHLFPLSPWGWLWVLGIPVGAHKLCRLYINIYTNTYHLSFHSLAAVYNDVLGPDATFEHAHLGVVSTTTEQSRGLDAKVSNTFPVVVHNAEAILLQDALILLFYFLQKHKTYIG